MWMWMWWMRIGVGMWNGAVDMDVEKEEMLPSWLLDSPTGPLGSRITRCSVPGPLSILAAPRG